MRRWAPVAFFVFFLFGIDFTLNHEPQRRAKEAKSLAVESYRYGAMVPYGYEHQVGKQRCEKWSIPRRFFCEEGVGSGVWRQLNKTGQSRLAEWLGALPQPSVFHIRGLGMAMNEVELWRPIILKKVRAHFPERSIVSLVDGWSFGRGLIGGLDLKVLSHECSNFTDNDFKDACFFGVGRALYFSDVRGRALEDVVATSPHGGAQLIMIGLGFAETFINGFRRYGDVALEVAADQRRVQAWKRGSTIAELYLGELGRDGGQPVSSDYTLGCVRRCRNEGLSVTTCLIAPRQTTN